MIPFIWHSSKDRNHSDRESISGCHGLRVGRVWLQRKVLKMFYGLNGTVFLLVMVDIILFCPLGYDVICQPLWYRKKVFSTWRKKVVVWIISSTCLCLYTCPSWSRSFFFSSIVNWVLSLQNCSTCHPAVYKVMETLPLFALPEALWVLRGEVYLITSVLAAELA